MNDLELENKKKKGTKQRGHPRDTPEVRISKSLSWLLRHGAEKAGLRVRLDGYAKVSDVLSNPMFRNVTFVDLERVVKRDQKSRFHLLLEPQTSGSSGSDDVKLELQPIHSASDIPMAVHGTSRKAWELIAKQGLSRMNRNHIHLAQGIPGNNVLSGMRNSSQILIFIDVQKALDAGIKFYLSMNGVVLTEGNADGFLSTEFFLGVENADHTPVQGWAGSQPIDPISTSAAAPVLSERAVLTETTVYQEAET
ncbi:KptA family-domain-containing protein [Phlebopus sp. FC_14]|nr:KptA family-domain-containing protein [Phlebopus sp. FC_14]